MSEAFHLQLAAEDPESVMLLFDTIGARFSFQPSERGLSYREERAGDEDVSLARVEVEGSYSSWGDTQMFSVIQRTAGRCDWSTRTESGTGIGVPVLITPSSPTLFVVDSLRASNVYLTAGMVQDLAETVYGTENTPVAFASAHPLTPRLGQYWSSLARLAQELVDTGTFNAPLVRAGLTRHLAVALLECFPLVGDRELRALSMAAQTRRYRIAKQFLDDHAHQQLLGFICELLAIGRPAQEAAGLSRKPTLERLPLRSVPVDGSTTQGDGSDASGIARNSRIRSTTR